MHNTNLEMPIDTGNEIDGNRIMYRRFDIIISNGGRCIPCCSLHASSSIVLHHSYRKASGSQEAMVTRGVKYG